MVAPRCFVAVAWVGLSACALARDGLGNVLTAEDPPEQVEEPSTPPPADEGDRTETDARVAETRLPDARVPDARIPDGRAPETADAGARADASAPENCPLAGLHALRLEAQVSWTPDYGWNVHTGWTPAVVAGQGAASLLALADVKDGMVSLRACAVRLPPVRAVTGAVVSGSFADATWDAIATTWSARVTTLCDQPGCTVRSDFAQPQLGLALSDGEAWPASSARLPAPRLRDEDGDGRPGVRYTLDAPLRMYSSYGYGWVDAANVTDLSLAMRIGTELEGALDSCGSASGRANATTLESRVLGCLLDTGSDCLDEQVAVLQQSVPTWTVSAASWTLTRLPAGSDCEDVRAALP